MSDFYYDKQDLKKFANVTEFNKELGEKFFDYYNSVLSEGSLTVKEKSVIALAVAHVLKCPYCIDAYTSTCIENGVDEKQMMEAVHVASVMAAGVTLAHSVQMMNKAKQLLLF